MLSWVATMASEGIGHKREVEVTERAYVNTMDWFGTSAREPTHC